MVAAGGGGEGGSLGWGAIELKLLLGSSGRIMEEEEFICSF